MFLNIKYIRMIAGNLEQKTKESYFLTESKREEKDVSMGLWFTTEKLFWVEADCGRRESYDGLSLCLRFKGKERQKHIMMIEKWK